MKAKYVIGGMFAGVAIGAAIGVLLAPASGDKTRTKLQKGSRKFLKQLRSNVDGSFESLKDKYNHGVDEIAAKGSNGIIAAREKMKV